MKTVQKLLLFTLLMSLANLPLLAGDKTQYPAYTISKDLLKGANAVVRLDETRFKITSLTEATEYHHYVITILNEKGSDHAAFVEFYNKFLRVTFTGGNLYNALGVKTLKIKPSDVRDYAAAAEYTLYSDHRIMACQPAPGIYPYTVEYTWEIYYRGLLNFPGWQPVNDDNIACEHAEYSVDVPAGLNLRIKEFNTKHAVSQKPKYPGTLFKWKLDSFQAVSHEDYAPAAYQYLPYVIVAPDKFEIDDYAGNMDSWASFGNWVKALQNQPDGLSKETVAKVIALTQNEEDPKEKVRKLYEFMQNRTRYVNVVIGIGGWRSFPASTVDRTGYGDCKALANYMHALLNVAGITSYYTLINGGAEPHEVFEDFPYNCFNHAIVCVPLKEDTLWLECTNQYNPCGYTGYFTDNRLALIITEKGGKLVRTHHYSLEENIRRLNATVEIAPDGNARAQCRTTFSGCSYEEVEEALNLKAEEQKKHIYNQFHALNIDLEAFSFKQEKSEVPIATEDLKFLVHGFATIGTERLFFAPILQKRQRVTLSQSKERKTDILIQRPVYEIDSINYLLPEGLEIEYLPPAKSMSTKFGSYTIDIHQSGNKITCRRTMKINDGQYAAGEYDAFSGFLKQVAFCDTEKIVLKRKK